MRVTRVKCIIKSFRDKLHFFFKTIIFPFFTAVRTIKKFVFLTFLEAFELASIVPFFLLTRFPCRGVL
jgi:hypothetical protein